MSNNKDTTPPPYSDFAVTGDHAHYVPAPTAPYPPGQPHQGYNGLQPPPPGLGPGVTVIMTPANTGNCPACKAGYLKEEFTCLGYLLCCLFFPLGVFCCLAMREKRCSNCGASFG